jgi:hypothetical protein
VFQTRYTEDMVEDLIDQKTGKPIPGRYWIQISKIEALDFDWSTIIKDGQQVQTVGTHWPLSRVLPKETRWSAPDSAWVATARWATKSFGARFPPQAGSMTRSTLS